MHLVWEARLYTIALVSWSDSTQSPVRDRYTSIPLEMLSIYYYLIGA